MRLKKWVTVLAVGVSVLTLAACSTTKKYNDSAIDDANMAASDEASEGDQAESSGVAQGRSFHDVRPMRQAAHQRTYYFAFDSNVVQDSDMSAIKANASYLANHPAAKVMLGGHTDPRGSREYNIGLGERRARAVENVLLSGGATSNQIRLVSYGAQKLASPGHSEADYQQDRRVVLSYLKR